MPSESIIGAALELRYHLDRTRSLRAALDAYGTIHGMSSATAARIMQRMAGFTP
jgi:hypothetical protein